MGSTEQLWEAKEIRRRLEEESGGRYCRYFLAAKGIEMSVCRRTQLDCGRPAELLLLLLLDQMLRRAATASQQHLTSLRCQDNARRKLSAALLPSLPEEKSQVQREWEWCHGLVEPCGRREVGGRRCGR